VAIPGEEGTYFIGQVYRATTQSPPSFQKTGFALNTLHYANDVKKNAVLGKNWYLMALYIERVTPDPTAPSFTFSLSNDGVKFGPEQMLFSGVSVSDKFLMTPSFVTKGSSVLGVIYGANPIDLLAATSELFARWLQKKVVITDSSGAQYALQGGYGPDRQWFQPPSSGSLQGIIIVYAEDGITPLGKGTVTMSTGQAYQLVIN